MSLPVRRAGRRSVCEVLLGNLQWVNLMAEWIFLRSYMVVATVLDFISAASEFIGRQCRKRILREQSNCGLSHLQGKNLPGSNQPAGDKHQHSANHNLENCR